MYSTKELNEVRCRAACYKLNAPTEFWSYKVQKLKKICNGAGPERWSSLSRTALTTALKRYEPSFAIHDLDYEIGTLKSEADLRLLDNMKKIWAKDFGIWRLCSIAGLVERFSVIPTVYAAVALAGGSAYEEAKEEGTANE